MNATVSDDIKKLEDEFDAAERDAQALVAGLTEEQGTRRLKEGSWCIAECLDHLATANAVYLRAMQEPATEGRALGRQRSGPMKPGVGGRLFIFQLEPPARWWSKLRAPRKIRPRTSPPLDEAYRSFLTSHAAVRSFFRANADLDLTHIRFPNPFIRGIRFSLATGLNVIIAHERRHLWQAWNVRHALEQTNA